MDANTDTFVSADAVLRRKCRTAYQHHRQAAAKDCCRLDYSISDLVALARASPLCHYCKSPLSFGFEFDHFMPIARTAQAHTLANIVCACVSCNAMKGRGMDGKEFAQLLALLATFHPHALADVRLRLVSGGKRYAGSRRSQKG